MQMRLANAGRIGLLFCLCSVAVANSPGAVLDLTELSSQHLMEIEVTSVSRREFVEWPADASQGPLVIGVLGDDGLAQAVEDLVERKTFGGKIGLTKHFRTLEDLRLCHVRSIHIEGKSLQKQVLELASTVPVLTVGEGRDFARAGSMIGLLLEARRLRFVMNAAAAKRSGVKIWAPLLQLAQTVRP